LVNQAESFLLRPVTGPLATITSRSFHDQTSAIRTEQRIASVPKVSYSLLSKLLLSTGSWPAARRKRPFVLVIDLQKLAANLGRILSSVTILGMPRVWTVRSTSADVLGKIEQAHSGKR